MRKFFFALAIILSGCVTDRNFNQSNVCDIFKTNPQWKSYAEKTKEKWGVPVSLQLSFIKQESSFNRTARPPRQIVLGFIPKLTAVLYKLFSIIPSLNTTTLIKFFSIIFV